MVRLDTDKGRIVQAAFQLAAERRWRDVSMRDIAAAAGISLAELRRSFGSKTQIIAAFIRAVDDSVLETAPETSDEPSPRDQLFDIIMSRFDAMAEFRPALKSIYTDTGFDSSLFGAVLNSQRWMLLAAGLDGDGVRGIARSVGLASLFGSVFQVWLEDDEPGLAKTMAALDRRLRRGESVMSSFERAVDAASDIARGVRGRWARRGEQSASHHDAEEAPAADGNFEPGPAGPGDDFGGGRPSPAS